MLCIYHSQNILSEKDVLVHDMYIYNARPRGAKRRAQGV